MRFLLDTNACVYYLNGTHPTLTQRLLHVGPSRLAVSALSVAELDFGARRSSRAQANLRRIEALLRELRVESFHGPCAREFGPIKEALLRAGCPIPDFDIAIAATAVALRYVVVSSDAHLRRIKSIAVEDWTRA